MPSTIEVGDRYEDAAEAYLHERGLRTLEKNFRSAGGEIDLVMCDSEGVIFVEVRYRRSNRFGGAEASVGWRKQTRIVRAAEYYLAHHVELANRPCRFDVIAINGPSGSMTLNWIKGAFSA